MERERLIFHIDVNSAFLSWESVYRLKKDKNALDLRTIPSAVGGDAKSRHGVVLAKSTPAKRCGVMTGEPLASAYKKCPDLVVVPSRFDLYIQCSRAMMELLSQYTPDSEKFSIDETFLDMTETIHLFGTPMDTANQIRRRIREELGFTVNIGIAPNKLLAKMASDFEKPDKVHTLFLREVPVKMWPLPLGELFMAGRSSVEALKKLEINTIGDLANADLSLIELHLKSHGKMLWEFANGIDHSPVQWEQAEAKGIGNSTTLAEDAATYEEVREVFAGLAESVGRRLRKAGQKANMVSMEIKYHDFQSMSHQTQLSKPTSDEQVLLDTACRLFQEAWTGEPVRLLGIRTAKLVDAGEPEQMSIFDLEPQKPVDEKRQRLNAAMNQIRKKYGDDAVMKASRMKKVK